MMVFDSTVEQNNSLQAKSTGSTYKQSFSSGGQDSVVSNANSYCSGTMDVMEPSVGTRYRRDDTRLAIRPVAAQIPHTTNQSAAGEGDNLSFDHMLRNSESWVKKELAVLKVPKVKSPDIDMNAELTESELCENRRYVRDALGARDTYAPKKEVKQVQESHSRSVQEGTKANNSNTTPASGERATGVNPYVQRPQTSDRDTDLNNLFNAMKLIAMLKTCMNFVIPTIVLVAIAIILDGLGFELMEIENSYGGEVEPQPDMDFTLMKLLCESPCTYAPVNDMLIKPLNTLTPFVAGNSSFAQELNSMYKSGLPYSAGQCTQVSGTQFALAAVPTIGASKTALTVTVDCNNATAPTAVCSYQLNWTANMHSYQLYSGTPIRGQDYVYHNKVVPFVAVKFTILCIAFILSIAALGVVASGAHKKQWKATSMHASIALLILSCLLCIANTVCGIVFVVMYRKAEITSPASDNKTISEHMTNGSIAVLIVDIAITAVAAILCGIAIRYAY